MGQHTNHDLLVLLHDVARLMRVEADKRARVDGMTRAQWALLIRLSRSPGLSQKEVADLLEVEPITVARLADRLERNGMIERRPDAHDRRIWRLHLRPAAAPVLQRIDIQWADMSAMISRLVPAETQAAMIAGLLRMKSNLLTNLEGPGADAAFIKEIA
jgi:DNA-binding MarR family transcriptional regulator